MRRRSGPDDPLTRAELAELVAGLIGIPQPAPGDPTATVTLAELDSRLVRALELQDAAATFLAGARTAGLAPPGRFGTEVVARLLGLRTNHPAAHDALELRPNDPVTRAEAAYSAARILRFRGGEADAVRSAAADVRPPGADAVAARDPPQGVLPRRLPLRLGRREREPHRPVRPAGPGRLRLLGLRLARLQAPGVPRSHDARRDLARPHDLRDERRGRPDEADPVRGAPARRRRLLRREGPAVEAGPGRPHGHRPRRRLDGPLLRGRNDRCPAHRLVPRPLRLGSQTARRGWPRAASPNPHRERVCARSPVWGMEARRPRRHNPAGLAS